MKHTRPPVPAPPARSPLPSGSPPSRTASRRQFFVATGRLAGTALVVPTVLPLARTADASSSSLHLASNAYSWHVFYQREQRDFAADLGTHLKDLTDSGLQGFEPGVGNADDLRRLVPLLAQHRLEMRSIYVNSTLHTTEAADKSLADILAVAKAARPAGTRIIVTNPNPIQWGGAAHKDDAQLRTQSAAMNRLGQELNALGMTLAYHNHDIELRQAAREFHHMMAGTDPRYVTLCLDAHWIYRGAGNSTVALFDIVHLYGHRVSELHLRQSRNGVWSETYDTGDIDYEALAKALRERGVKPHLVLEVAVESGTPKTLSPVEAHRQSVAYARRIWAGFGS